MSLYMLYVTYSDMSDKYSQLIHVSLKFWKMLLANRHFCCQRNPISLPQNGRCPGNGCIFVRHPVFRIDKSCHLLATINNHWIPLKPIFGLHNMLFKISTFIIYRTMIITNPWNNKTFERYQYTRKLDSTVESEPISYRQVNKNGDFSTRLLRQCK
jgi:hypothetical protein